MKWGNGIRTKDATHLIMKLDQNVVKLAPSIRKLYTDYLVRNIWGAQAFQDTG